MPLSAEISCFTSWWRSAVADKRPNSRANCQFVDASTDCRPFSGRNTNPHWRLTTPRQQPALRALRRERCGAFPFLLGSMGRLSIERPSQGIKTAKAIKSKEIYDIFISCSPYSYTGEVADSQAIGWTEKLWSAPIRIGEMRPGLRSRIDPRTSR